MTKITRRTMLWTTSAGVAALSGVAALIGVNQGKKADAAATTATGATATGALTVHIRSVRNGRVSIMMGEREVVVNNPALVRELLKSVQ